MRFPMINCSKYAQQCQNGILKKTCRATTVPYSIMWISPQCYVNIGSMGHPLINPVLRLKTLSQTCVGGISHLNLVNWTLDMNNQ